MTEPTEQVAEAKQELYKAEIRRSFDLVKPIPDQAAAIFYPTLWELDPTTKPLFAKTDMTQQGRKLMKVLGLAVSMLSKMDALVPVLKALGRKHVSYGVKAYMYASVRDALLLTFEKGLGEECTPETKEAWTWVLGIISAVCIEASKEVDPSYGDHMSPPETSAAPRPEPETQPHETAAQDPIKDDVESGDKEPVEVIPEQVQPKGGDEESPSEEPKEEAQKLEGDHVMEVPVKLDEGSAEIAPVAS